MQHATGHHATCYRNTSHLQTETNTNLFSYVGSLTSASSDDCGGDGILVSGAKVQTVVNGCYRPRGDNVNGFVSFENRQGIILYWQPHNGGQWVMADEMETGYRAFASAKTGETGPTVFPTWHTLDNEGKVSDACPVGWDFGGRLNFDFTI